MELERNIFKQRLLAGEQQFGLWLGLPDPTAAEILGAAGFDWLLLDGEHAPFDLGAVLAHLRALAPYPVAPIVRAVNGDPALLKQLLDVGAQTILIPMVDDAASAAQLVQAVRYPPDGFRGLGSSLARAAHWNQTVDYLHRANSEICLLVQAESVTAMENLADMAAVDGVDGIFIGPSDLAASMGHIGNPSHPEVIDAIESGIKTILESGKQAGLLALDKTLAHRFAGLGATFIGVGVDTVLLSQSARSLAAEFCKVDDATAKPSIGY